MLSLIASLGSTRDAPLAPVILMPGLAGSRLQAQLNHSVEPHFWCEKQTKGKPVQLWLALTELVPEQKDCLMSRIALTFNASTGNYTDAPGVLLDTNVDFGDVGGISSLDPSLASATAYFKKMVEALTALGYEAGKTLHGAPYDWRKAPDGHVSGLYPKLRSLIEDTVARNGRAAHLITHSLGGPTALGFLNMQSAAWRAAHVASFAPISGPFGGSSEQLKAYVSGDNFGIPFVPSDYLQPIQVSAASGAFMLPTPAAFGKGDVLVSTATKNYTTADWAAFLSDLGHTQAVDIIRHLDSLGVNMAQQRPPDDVRMHVITSSGVPTPESFTFDGSFAPGYKKVPKHVGNGDGDGTVNLQSLLLPHTTWSNASGSLSFFNVTGVSHFSMVSDEHVLAYVREQVLGL